jgi:hypothetical protein
MRATYNVQHTATCVLRCQPRCIWAVDRVTVIESSRRSIYPRVVGSVVVAEREGAAHS